jgi:NADPH-dependent curcumin reductase CurA
MSATSLPQVSRYLVVQNHIVDTIDLSGPNAIFALKTENIPSFDAIPSDSIVAQALYLSNDPGARLRIQKGSDSAHGRKDFAVLPLGSPMKGFAVLKVLAVGGSGQESSETINVGDLVAATAVWCDFAVLKKTEVTKVGYVT